MIYQNKPTYNLSVGVDDIHPEDNWGLTDDEQFKYLIDLNEEFGLKYTLFVPANFHNRCPISSHAEWFNKLKEFGCFEFAAHGYLHNTKNKIQNGECECIEIDTYHNAELFLGRIYDEWRRVGIKPIGWKHPGWMATDPVCHYVEKMYTWAAINRKHDNYNWKIPILDKFIGINDTIYLYPDSLYSDFNGIDSIILQSHIAGDWNKNVWNYSNYKSLRQQLLRLFSENNIITKTFSEILIK